MANYDSIDLQFTALGDYLPGDDGDFADTAADQIQSIIQDIQSITNSSLGDWSEHLNYGSSLDDYIGYPNNRDTVKEITNRLRTSLINNNIVQSGDLAIQAIPIDRHKIFLIISLRAAATANNSLTNNNNVVVTFIYDYLERGVSFVNSSGGQ